MKKVFILTGPSGVGKTTLRKEFKNKYGNIGIEKIITTTTRQKRNYEIYGEDYYFVDIDEFKKLIKNKQLIEYAEVHGNFYGSTYSELERIIKKGKVPLYIVDPQGVKFLKNRLSDVYDVKTIFILPPSKEELKKRLLKRGEDLKSENFKIRLKESLMWLAEKDNYDYQIVNDDLNQALERLRKVIET